MILFFIKAKMDFCLMSVFVSPQFAVACTDIMSKMLIHFSKGEKNLLNYTLTVGQSIFFAHKCTNDTLRLVAVKQ